MLVREMEVIQIGHVKTLDGEEVTGMIVEASTEELRAVGPNVLYKQVTVVPLEDRDGSDDRAA